MTEPMDRTQDPELADPGSKTQPAEGGREEAEGSLEVDATDERPDEEAAGA